MSEINLVIKISEDTVNKIKDNALFFGSIPSDIRWDVANAIVNGTPTKEETSRPHGEWIIRKNRQGKHIYSVCSRCNVAHLDTDFPNFCENCGSDNRPRVLDEAIDGEGKDGNVREGESE